MVPYKRFDLAIRACESLGKKLVIAGSGPEEKRLRSIAQKCTSFRIAPSDAELRKLMRQAKGFIFPGVEDFGIIAIETLASGTPIIGYHRGGIIDYVSPQKNGVLFKEQTPESLGDSLVKFEGIDFDTTEVKNSAAKFSRENFCEVSN